MGESTEDIKLLFEEASIKINISKEVAAKYGPQAGITLYEILINLDEMPTIKLENSRVLLINKGVCFPMWERHIRTINPKSLRSPSNCPEIRHVVNSALYCLNAPPEREPTYSSKPVQNSALKVFSMLNEIEKHAHT
jgi:hypothetical protein